MPEIDNVTQPFGDELDRRGMLTENDRKLLLGEKTYEDHEMERRAWKRLRERVQGGLLDSWLLFHHLPPDQRRELIMDPTGHLTGPKNWDIGESESTDVYREEEVNALITLIGFAYLLADDVNLPFELLVEHALLKASQRLHPAPFGLVESEVKIETQAGVEIESVMEALEAGESISGLEYQELVRFLMDDWDTFVEDTADVELPDLDKLDDGEHLSRAESLILYARSNPEDGTLEQAITDDVLHPEVRRQFSP